MDLFLLLGVLGAACTGVWILGRLFGPPRLYELFRTSHELGWPIGVQEEDLPPAFGSRVAARRPDAAAADKPATPIGAGWREPVRARGVRVGTAGR